jgi:hypothetical protein
VIPTIRARDPSRYSFPTELCFNDDGELYTRRRSRDERLWEVSGILVDHAKQLNLLSDVELTLLVLEVLQAYYRIGTAELAMLAKADMNPMENTFLANAIGYMTDWQVFETMQTQKKTTPDEAQESPSVSPGATVDSHITNPVGLT